MIFGTLSFRIRLTLWFLLIFALLYGLLIAVELLVFAYTMDTDTRLPSQFFDQIQRMLILSVPLGLLAAGVAGYVLAGRVVDPLSRLADTARQVGPHHLDHRVDLEADSPELIRLQTELNDALKRIEAGYHAQGRFIANISHEMRTPIAVMLSQGQLLRRRKDKNLAGYRAFVRDTVDQMQRLRRMIESFLVLARADHEGRLEDAGLHHFYDLILDAVQHNGPLAAQHHVRVVPSLTELDRDCVVHGNASLLMTMVDNLIRNAIGHSPYGEMVEVNTACDEHHVTVTVRDFGSGISKDSLPHLFDRFYCEPKAGKRRKGVGLGLAIVKTIVDLHDGTIRAYNHDAGGAAFEVKLPLVDMAEGAASP